MSVFNSLGSNYKSKLGSYSPVSILHANSKLLNYLKSHYHPQDAQLTYKGREAIALLLNNLNLPRGSYVAINGFTCYAVYQAVRAAGLKPLYLDIEKDELNFSAATLEKALKLPPYTTAVIIQNTLGIPCDIEAIKKICGHNNAVLVEDLAHSIGLVYENGAEAGTIGEASALSFSQDKMIDAVSGGAAIINTLDKLSEPMAKPSTRTQLISRLYPWLTYAIRKTFVSGFGKVTLKTAKAFKLLPGPMTGSAEKIHSLPAWNASQALRAYHKLPKIIIHRQRIAAIYREHLPGKIQFKHIDSAVYLRFPIKVEKPEELIKHLKRTGIYLSDRWYDAPVAPKRFFGKTDYRAGQCPNAEYIAQRIVNLPTHMNVSETQAHQIAERINQWLTS